jgi:hypothetical protein
LTNKGEEGQQQKNNVDSGTHLEMIEDEYDLSDNGDLVLVSSKVVKIDRCGNEISLREADTSSQSIVVAHGVSKSVEEVPDGTQDEHMMVRRTDYAPHVKLGTEPRRINRLENKGVG